MFVARQTGQVHKLFWLVMSMYESTIFNFTDKIKGNILNKVTQNAFRAVIVIFTPVKISWQDT